MQIIIMSQRKATVIDFYFYPQAALKVDKYHIALRHLQRIKDTAIIRDYKNKDGQNLLHILALETTPGKDSALQLKV
jgi:hypothetical protein